MSIWWWLFAILVYCVAGFILPLINWRYNRVLDDYWSEEYSWSERPVRQNWITKILPILFFAHYCYFLLVSVWYEFFLEDNEDKKSDRDQT